MSILFAGEIEIAYSQFYILNQDALAPDPTDAFRGQTNGLVGASVSGSAFFHTGTQQGRVQLRIELVDTRPGLDTASSSDSAEVSFLPAPPVVLRTWSGEGVTLDLPREWLRLRYSAQGMDAAQSMGGSPEGVPGEAYAVELWRELPGLDAIGKQVSEHARYLNTVPASFDP